MNRSLFLRIHDALVARYEYFQHRPDATGRYGLTGLQKCVASIRILAYGSPADSVDEYVRIGESTAREALHKFCSGVIEVFGPEYLRAPNDNDVRRITAFNERRGFPGMLGSIDCMHWRWKNCPVSYKGYFTGRGKHPTIILEAVATHDLRIWHAYFGLPGSLNDINVLHRSTVFHNYLQGTTPTVNFEVNGNTYNIGYFLADGIYPEWAAFVKTLSFVHNEKSREFKTQQEAARKDIERAFGVLQSRWGIIRGPAYGWDIDELTDIITACIILHNMIVEYEGMQAVVDRDFGPVRGHPLVEPTDLLNSEEMASSVSRRHREASATVIGRRRELTNQAMHRRLQRDLIEHMWNFLGSRGRN
jgi:hypothetical protein